MPTIEKRKNTEGETVYRVRVRTRGANISETFYRLADAKAWARDTESNVERGRYAVLEADRRTLGELVERYIAEVIPTKKDWAKQQVTHLRDWLAIIGNVKLSRVTTDAIERARLVVAKTPYKRSEHGEEHTREPGTINRRYAALQHCLGKAFDWGWIERNPIDRVKKYREPSGRVRFLSTYERDSLLKACREVGTPQMRLLVLLALCSGARDMELRGLEWDRVNLRDGSALVEETKNGQRRTLTIAGAALDELREWAKVRRIDTKLVFPNTNGDKPLQVRKVWEQVRDAAGLHDFRFHDLRHSAASELAAQGATLREIGAVLGHRTAQMTQRYAHLTEQHQSALVRKMAARVMPGIA
jgi:integrase